MISVIGGIFKYSLLVVTVLVLSHIVEVKGVTISQHVLNAMHGVSGYNPKIQADRITASFTKTMQSRVSELNRIDAEISSDDQKALNHVIETSQQKRR